MDRSKIVARITGAIALLLGIAYLVLVQILDFRGEMVPAPQEISMEAPVDLPPPTFPSFSLFSPRLP